MTYSLQGSLLAAAGEPYYVLSLLGGLGSWHAGRRLVQERGKDRLKLLHTDCGSEEPDTYRFLIESAADLLLPASDDRVRGLARRALALPPVERRDLKEERLGLLSELAADAERCIPGLHWVTHGKDVWDVFFEERYLGNSRIDPCSGVLKREAAEAWVKERYYPGEAVLVLGIDHTEAHRHERARARWQPYEVDSPLCRAPLEGDPKGAAKELCERSGMEVPILYRLGWGHSNCGGACVKAGKASWTMLMRRLPERFRYHEQREQEIRAHRGKEVSILREQRDGVRRNVTLRELRERVARADAGGLEEQPSEATSGRD